MNTKSTKAVLIMLAAGLLSSCSSDDSLGIGNVKEIRATLNGFQLDESLTRTQYNISETKGFETIWAAGDILGIYPIGGDQVSFPISDGVGTTSAKFDGGSWALRSEYKYAAYYPFSSDFYTTDQTAIPVSFLGQVQNGNNTTSHLAAVDFMAAAGTKPSSNGSVNLSFNHVGCFLCMQFKMPNAGTFVEAKVETDGGRFTTQGTVNLAATTPAVTATNTAEALTLALSNVSTASANQTITLYMMVAPDNLSGRTLTFTVKDSNGNLYTKKSAGKTMTATYAYNYSLTLETTGAGGTTGGGGSDPFNGHAYVDLGLKDEQGHTIYWATCNVGATTPEDYGDYFAWGETEPYYQAGHSQDSPCSSWKTGKTGYNWANYKWCNGDYYTQTKYCTSVDYGTVDNKTVLELEDDAATQNWGGNWRMPTKDEQDQLRTSCTWTWNSTKKGYTVTGPNGNSIFLPAAGYRSDSDLNYAGSNGYYWSSSLGPSLSHFAYYLYFNSWSQDTDDYTRYLGRSVRAVCVSIE